MVISARERLALTATTLVAALLQAAGAALLLVNGSTMALMPATPSVSNRVFAPAMVAALGLPAAINFASSSLLRRHWLQELESGRSPYRLLAHLAWTMPTTFCLCAPVVSDIASVVMSMFAALFVTVFYYSAEMGGRSMLARDAYATSARHRLTPLLGAAVALSGNCAFIIYHTRPHILAGTLTNLKGNAISIHTAFESLHLLSTVYVSTTKPSAHTTIQYFHTILSLAAHGSVATVLALP